MKAIIFIPMLLKQIKRITRLKPPVSVDNPIDLSFLQDQLSDGLFSLVESSFAERQKDLHNSKATKADVNNIIEAYAKKNKLLAMASSVVSGPLGILGSIPELILNFGNQMNMIYDLSCAYDKECFVNKDVLLEIPFAAFGGNTQLSVLQNAAVDLQDSAEEILKEKAVELSKAVVERTMKKSVVQFIPVAGSILMGTWSQMTTKKIAKASKAFFDQAAHYEEHIKPPETEDITRNLQIQKIKALANLIECNDDINEAQIAFIAPVIENAAISKDLKKFYLDHAMRTGSNFWIDYQLLQDFEEDEPLIFELVMLAKRSGHIDPVESNYIRKVANKMQLDMEMVEELMGE